MAKNIKIILLVFLLLFPLLQISGAEKSPIELEEGRTMKQIYDGILNLGRWFFSFLLAAGVIGVVVSGFLFVSSGGEPGKINAAKQILLYSLIGVVLGTFAMALVEWATDVQIGDGGDANGGLP